MEKNFDLDRAKKLAELRNRIMANLDRAEAQGQKSWEERFIEKRARIEERIAQNPQPLQDEEGFAQSTAALEKRYAAVISEAERAKREGEKVLKGLQKQTAREAKRVGKKLSKYSDILPGVDDLIKSLQDFGV